MAEDREIAGIRCLQILARLDDYVDGTLEQTVRERVDAHLEQCDWCTKFGGRYAGVVGALRAERSTPHDSRDADFARALLASSGTSSQ